METNTDEINVLKESDVHTEYHKTESCTIKDPGSLAVENDLVVGTSAQGQDENALVEDTAQGQDENTLGLGTSARGQGENASIVGTSAQWKDENAIVAGTSAQGQDENEIVAGTSAQGQDENEVVAGTSDECEDLEPYIGMEFNSEWDAQRFYFDYAENMGFKVRIHCRRRSPHTWKTVGVEFVCSREGFRREDSKCKRRNVRSGCMAMLRIRRTEFRRSMPRRLRKKTSDVSRKWAVVKFIKEHNHDLGPSEDVPFLQSHGHLVDESGETNNIFPLQGCRTFIQGLRKGIIIKKVDDHNTAETEDIVENPAANLSTDSNEPASFEPYVGMEFDSEEAATVFYFAYATRVGFDIRINCRRRSAHDGATTGVQFVCTKEGFRRKECKNTRQQTREGCMARIHLKKGASGKWIVRKLVKDHCHELTPGEVPIFRSYKVVSTQSDGCGDTIFTLQGRSKKSMQDRATHIQNLRESNFGKVAQNVLEYFKHKQTGNASFFYAIQVDKEYRLTNLFWVDPRSRMAYNYFGDVVTIDVTFNRHGIALVLFSGSNHHKQSILFGSAFFLDESEASFVWLFNTWLEAMSGRHPTSIISIQDAAVEAAIKKVFPGTRCLYCRQDIMKNIPEKLGHVECNKEDLMRDFSKCINFAELNDEFESCWKAFVEKYELSDNGWLQMLYSNREQWVRDTSANLFTPRNDITNSFFGPFINAFTSLQAFVDQCEKAIDKQCEKEFEEDFKTCYMKPIMKTGLPMEVQAAEIYTRTIFLDFQEQLFQSLHHTAEITNEDGPICTARVMEFGAGKSGYSVTFNSSEVKATCSCQMFEYAGILCRHALRVLSIKNITMLPPHCILKRWTRNSISAELDKQKPAALDNAQDSWASRYNHLYCQAAKYAWEASSTLNIYHVAIRALRKALQEVDDIKKNIGVVALSSAPVNGSSLEGNNHERNVPENAMSGVTMSDHQQGRTEGHPTTTSTTTTTTTTTTMSNKPASEEQQKKKRKCQVCKHPNHDKRKCPLLRAAGGSSNVISSIPESHQSHGGTIEQFSLTHVIPGVPTTNHHFLRYV